MIHDVARDVVRHGREARQRSGQKIKMLTTLSLSPPLSIPLSLSFSLSLSLSLSLFIVIAIYVLSRGNARSHRYEFSFPSLWVVEDSLKDRNVLASTPSFPLPSCFLLYTTDCLCPSFRNFRSYHHWLSLFSFVASRGSHVGLSRLPPGQLTIRRKRTAAEKWYVALTRVEISKKLLDILHFPSSCFLVIGMQILHASLPGLEKGYWSWTYIEILKLCRSLSRLLLDIFIIIGYFVLSRIFLADILTISVFINLMRVF